MSGIAGIFNRNGAPVANSELSGMVDAMARRGPDGQRNWQGGAIGLGHAALNATPESLFETQPLLDGATGNVITADIRLDNRAELIHLLRLTGHPKELIGDAQLVLAAYEKWGERCVHHLLGDFAFAIWDEKAQQLFCARDHFGVKPLHVYVSNDLFAFASDVQALLALEAVPRAINDERVIDFLVMDLEGYDDESTFFKEILRLPPAHTIHVSTSGLCRSRYWQLETGEEIRLKSDDEYEEAFIELFTESIRCRLRTAGPLASMLSGGMDSSSIVAIAEKLLDAGSNSPLLTFSAVSSHEPDCIETRSIETVLASKQVQSHCVSHQNIKPLCGNFDEVIARSYYPFDLFMTLPRVMYCSARKQGASALLAGTFGDEVLSLNGIASIRELIYTKQWRRAYKEAAAMSAGDISVDRRNAWSLLFLATRSAMVPQFVRTMRRRAQHIDPANYTCDSPLRLSPSTYQLVENRQAKMREPFSINGSARQQKTTYLRHPWIVGGLERYDRISADQSIEARHPILDKRMVEFCLALPCTQKFSNNTTKVILRRSMRTLLPNPIVKRKTKEHLGWSFTMAWLREEDKLVESTINSELDDLHQLIDLDKVAKAYHNYGQKNCYSDESIVFYTVVLARWLKHHPS